MKQTCGYLVKLEEEYTVESEVQSASWHSLCFDDRTSRCERQCKISKTKEAKHNKGKLNGGKKERSSTEIIALCSCEIRRISAPALHLFPCPLFFNLLLCSFSPLSLLLTVWVFAACCHGYSWSLMHCVTFLWDQLTLAVVCVCVCYCIYGWTHEKKQKMIFKKFKSWMSLSSFTFLILILFLSGSQQPPGGFRAAPGLSGGQEDQGIKCRHKVDILIAYSYIRFSWIITPKTPIKNLQNKGNVKKQKKFIYLSSVLQSIHSVQRRLLSLLHRHVLQPHGREGEAAGLGGGTGQTAGSQGNRSNTFIPNHLWIRGSDSAL